MKKLLSLLGLAAILATALPSHADVGTLDLGNTNAIAASTTTTTAGATGVGSAVSIDNRDNVGLVLSFQGSAASTGNVVFLFARSADNSTFETVNPISITVAANGTTAVACYTNLPVAAIGAAGYLKCTSIANAATNSITNLVMQVVKKRLQ